MSTNPRWRVLAQGPVLEYEYYEYNNSEYQSTHGLFETREIYTNIQFVIRQVYQTGHSK